MKFEHQYGPTQPLIVMEVHEDASLPEVLMAFESFLKACTYNFDGQLEIVNEEET